jgi:hypothetical protein
MQIDGLRKPMMRFCARDAQRVNEKRGGAGIPQISRNPTTVHLRQKVKHDRILLPHLSFEISDGTKKVSVTDLPPFGCEYPHASHSIKQKRESIAA